MRAQDFHIIINGEYNEFYEFLQHIPTLLLRRLLAQSTRAKFIVLEQTFSRKGRVRLYFYFSGQIYSIIFFPVRFKSTFFFEKSIKVQAH